MKNVLFDKCIVFMSCLIISLFLFYDKYSPAFICLTIVFSCVHFLDYNLKRRIVLNITFFILCMFFNELIVFIPLAVYDAMFIGANIMNLIYIIPIIMNFQTGKTSYIEIIIILVFAIILKIKTKKILEQDSCFKKLRDDTYEINTVLEDKNKQLIINQDYELKMATMNERNRISKELHDSIGHLLSRSLIQIGAMIVISKDENEKKELNRLKDSLSKGMDSIRDTIHNMHDSSFNIKAKIEELVREFTFCEIGLDYYIEKQPSADIRYGFVSIVKEALSNVIKHSDATIVNITIREQTAFYQLIIEDNGNVTNDVKKRIEKIMNSSEEYEITTGMGIAGMRDRMCGINGTMNISTEKGMKIFISVPKKLEVEEE